MDVLAGTEEHRDVVDTTVQLDHNLQTAHASMFNICTQLAEEIKQF
jgi:hypothetical protein